MCRRPLEIKKQSYCKSDDCWYLCRFPSASRQYVFSFLLLFSPPFPCRTKQTKSTRFQMVENLQNQKPLKIAPVLAPIETKNPNSLINRKLGFHPVEGGGFEPPVRFAAYDSLANC